MSIRGILVHFVMERNRRKSRKREPWLGKRLLMPREGKKPVEVILYRPQNPIKTPMPALFNVHGGAWVGGDASGLDSQCAIWAEKLGAFVVNINYTKVDDKPFPYMQEEVRDTVLFFAAHAEEYCIDPVRFSLIGYSAGGHICAGTALMLRDVGFRLNSQFLCYPFLDFHIFDHGGVEGFLDDKTVKLMSEVFFRGGADKYAPYMSPASASAEALRGLAPCELVICQNDQLFEQAVAYKKRLFEADVPVTFKQFPKATHGFLEGNWPETQYPEDAEQKKYRDEAMDYIAERLRIHWED